MLSWKSPVIFVEFMDEQNCMQILRGLKMNKETMNYYIWVKWNKKGFGVSLKHLVSLLVTLEGNM